MIVADPGAMLVMVASACVWPPFMVTVAGTVTIVLFEDERITGIPLSGAFAGLLLESWSWTTKASWERSSEGSTGGNPYTASLYGTGATVIRFSCTVA